MNALEQKIDYIYLKNVYDKFKNTNEENIKNHVVTAFLKMLGYNTLEFYYEHPTLHKVGRSDIAINIPEKNYTYIYIEVKSANKKLTETEQKQLASYLKDRDIEWGILTNGRNYILINSSIKSLPAPEPRVLDRIIFNIDIFNKKDQTLVSYLTKESIFNTEVTNFFRDIAKFKAYKFPEFTKSWDAYKGTLVNFFKYYGKINRRYRQLSDIRLEEFEEYLMTEFENKNSTEIGKNIKSETTFKNKHSHIRSFFSTLEQYGEIKSHHFKHEVEKTVSKIQLQDKKYYDFDILNDTNINLILNSLEEKRKRKEGLRNLVIFHLCLAFGLERSTIVNLTENNIKKNKLIIGERELVLPNKINLLLDELLKEKKKAKIKDEYLFHTFYNGVYKQTSEGAINFFFDNFKSLNPDEEFWGSFSPTFIRTNLIRKMFENNYPIQDICYQTGIDLVNLNKIISFQDILSNNKVKKKNKFPVHPFEQFLN